MSDPDLSSCIEEIRDLWPEWEPNAGQLRLWESKLRPLSYPIAIAAIREEAAGQTRILKRPVMGRVLQHAADARKAQGRAAGTSQDREDRRKQCEPALAYKLVCVEQGTGTKRQGTELEVWFGRQRNLDRTYPDALARDAERRQKQVEDLYGGTWIIEQHWGLLEEVPF